MDMDKWLRELAEAKEKKALPLLSFPGIRFLSGVTVRELLDSSELQAKCLEEVARRTDSAACVSFMDLSVEAEAFGAQIQFFDDEVPAVRGALVTTMEEAETLAVPSVWTGRTGICVEAIRKTVEAVKDKPVFAGAIGPFSLAGRLVDVGEAMMLCYDEPELLHTLLEKCVAFSVAYITELKKAGANGVVIAEPLAGLISPSLEEEFSSPYVRKIVEAVQDETFPVIYHNCGDYAYLMTESIKRNGCKAYHFGNSMDMLDLLGRMGPDHIVMGNIDPAGLFRNGTPDTMKKAVTELLERCAGHPNFIPSSGCDIPPAAPWENIEAFYEAIHNFYN